MNNLKTFTVIYKDNVPDIDAHCVNSSAELGLYIPLLLPLKEIDTSFSGSHLTTEKRQTRKKLAKNPQYPTKIVQMILGPQAKDEGSAVARCVCSGNRNDRADGLYE